MRNRNLWQWRIATWVSEDGTYGTGPIVLLDPEALTDEDWRALEDCSDSERYDIACDLNLGRIQSA